MTDNVDSSKHQGGSPGDPPLTPGGSGVVERDGTPVDISSSDSETQGGSLADPSLAPGGSGGRNEVDLADVACQSGVDFVDVVCQTEFFYSFSSKTCQELLPQLTPDQLDFEMMHFKAHDQIVDLRSRKPSDAAKTVALKNCFANNIISDLKNINHKYDKLTVDISYLLREAETHLKELRTVADSSTRNSVDPVPAPVDTGNLPAPLDTGNIPDPVCFSDLCFSDLSVETILEQLNIQEQSTCNRKTGYYGDIPYSYGRVTHSPQKYPDCELFTNIFDKISATEPEFTQDNYTCLVNYYPDGTAYIPQHQDNEEALVPGSSIYTISVGAERDLKYTNIIGPIREKVVKVTHGSLFVMTQGSQSTWRHGIVRDPSVREPRVSLTFRRLRAGVPASGRRSVGGAREGGERLSMPPIAPPPPVRLPQPVAPIGGTHSRILLLTDSIISKTPTYIFDQVPGHKCVKKMNFRLKDIFNFEPEFGYSNYVIISGGINDLSRHGLNAHTLADLVCGRLRDACRKHSNTVFLFNSILLTKLQWLNTEVVEFNRIMFELSHTIPNLNFFDSHEVLLTSGLRSVLETDPQRGGNGIHVTGEAQRIITRHLVNGVLLLHTRSTGGSVVRSRVRDWHWPLRPSYRHLLERGGPG